MKPDTTLQEAQETLKQEPIKETLKQEPIKQEPIKQTLKQKTLNRSSQTPDRMTAAVITGAGQMELMEAPVPDPGPEEVLIRMEGCGVCSSNLPPWEGREWFSYPMEPGAPGHEGWGVVEKTGERVTSLKPGDRVTALSYHAFAEYDTARADQTVKLPDSFRDQPVPGEPLGCAMNIIRRSAIEPGMHVAVIGAGFLGCLLVQLAIQNGASVTAISRRRSSLEMARQFGAERTLSFEKSAELPTLMEEITDGKLCEVVIEATGKQEPLTLAAQLTAERGRLVVAGYHQDGPRQVDMQLWNWRGLDVINAHERDPGIYLRGMQEAVDALAEGRLNPAPLYTHTFGIESAQQAFQTLQQQPETFTKALILF